MCITVKHVQLLSYKPCVHVYLNSLHPSTTADTGQSVLDRLPPRGDCVPNFLQWLDDHKVDHSGVELVETPGRGWGVVAQKDFTVCLS